jgi:F-type H+-transporting ATPase subunit epsilon
MADSNTFHCSIITPERKVLQCDATFVAFLAHDGEMGVLRNRAPLICKLGIGLIRIETGGQARTLFINEGFAHVVANRLTILTDDALAVSEMNGQAAEKALADAMALKITDEASFTARAKAVRRAQVQRKLAETGR